jgi:hypothetical protein
LHRQRSSRHWEQSIDEESSLKVCEFLEAGAFTPQAVQAFQTVS